MSTDVMSRPAAVTLAQTLALLLPFAVVASGSVATYAIILIAALIAALGWEALFCGLRRRSPGLHGVTTALIIASLCPPEVAVWQVLLTVSLGVVLGELVFGGRGFGFLSPATVALVLLIVSFPDLQLLPQSQAFALSALPGGLLLLGLGLVSGRVLVATAVAVFAVFALRGHVTDPIALATALAFGAVFLIADPFAAATTQTGRWIYGALAGGLIAVFSPAGEITTQAVVFAALLASIFAPLIDHLVVIVHAARWRRRHDA